MKKTQILANDVVPSAPVSPRKSNFKTVGIALAASVVAAGLGWSAANRSAASETPSAAATGARTDVPAVADNFPSSTEPETPEQILNAIPEVAPTTTAATTPKIAKVDTEIARFKALARNRPNEPTYWVSLGDALMQKGRELVDPHYYDYAEKTYARSLAVSAKNPEAMLGMAWVTGGRHQFKDSIAWAEKALAIRPQIHAAHGLIGDAHVENGDYDAAFKSYQAMLDIRPDISSYSRGANLLFLTGDTRKATWLMDTAIKTGGPYAENTAWCRARLADMHLDMGAVFVAEQTLKPALKATPQNYHVLAAMGRIRESQNRNEEAIALFRRAVTVTPQHEALVALGDLYAARGDKAEAEKMYAQVEATHEHHLKHGVHNELYMARFWVDHDRQKERALKIALANAPTAKSAMDTDAVAWVLYKNNRNAEAKKSIDASLAIGAPDSLRLYHAGMIYAKDGDRVSAQKYLYQALNRNPRFHIVGAPQAVKTLKELGATPVARQ